MNMRKTLFELFGVDIKGRGVADIGSYIVA